ncbi:MAG: hypothetical protein IPJ82_06270 [Lewinellaceae bacterium]|nr:hypothetical protein [Lewinellaceae bacterium]
MDKDFVFPDPANPFQTDFPESISRANVTTDQLQDDFVGIKTGDVNNTAMPDNLFVPEDRAAGTLFLQTNDRNVQHDEEITVRFNTSEKVAGYQFTLNTNGLEVLDILPGAGISADNFAVFPASSGEAGAVTAAVENGADEFSLVFRAKKAGRLSDMLGISSRITRAEAYLPAEALAKAGKLDLALLFDNRLVSKAGFGLYQNQPNPFGDHTAIGCYLPEDSDATLSIFDETGRVLHTESGYYLRGYHTFYVAGRQLTGAAGLLYYKLETATDSAVRKMVLIR